MKIPLISAGSFGELRPNHFHAGIDLKTQYKEGIPVYATEDGFISRIRVGVWGYGKALYVQHPNGYTTVYAHLKEFVPELESYIINEQYERETYEINAYPGKDDFKFKKGDLIAYSGATGGFVGPHLHYEIRDSKTEHILNPLNFNLPLQDNVYPRLRAVRFHIQDSVGSIDGLNQDRNITYRKIKNHQYRSDTIYIEGKVIPMVEAYDLQSPPTNKNGLYSVSAFLDDKMIFQYKMDEFSFGYSKEINRLIDYNYYQENGIRFQKLYIPELANLLVYNRTLDSDGVLDLKQGEKHLYTIDLKDFEGNLTSIEIPIAYLDSKLPLAPKPEGLLIDHEQYFRHDSKNSFIGIGSNTFYQDHRIEVIDSILGLLELKAEQIPMKKNMKIGLKTFNLEFNDSIPKGLMIGTKDSKGRINYLKTVFNDSMALAETKSFGKFEWVYDSIPPVIKAQNFKAEQWISNYSELRLKIEDKQSGIQSYEGRFNGSWMLLVYDPKTDTITYDLDDIPMVSTKQILEIKVTDLAGNVSEYQTILFKKIKK